MKLPIHETFHTFQGEGGHAGRSAYFIRTFGCPVHCPWCDSAGTWHPDYIPSEIRKATPATLASEAARSNADFTVVTGGEPAIHDLSELTAALDAAGQPGHLETSGAFAIRGTFAWITLSPKRWKPPLKDNLRRTDEIKIIVDSPNAIAEYIDLLKNLGFPFTPETSVWLHPEWSLREESSILDAITDWVKVRGAPFRAGWQLHKNYAADQKDARSAAPAPLGGNRSLGF